MTIDPDYAMRQAADTADFYLIHALEDIDKRLGKGYAAKHPELIAGYIQAASTDYLAYAVLAFRDAIEHLPSAVREIGAAIDRQE